MAISAKLVKELREKTGAGMMDCKKALIETDGDIDKAVDYLRENGIAKAAKKADRIAAEGAVYITSEGNEAVIVEINSETDFVARNEAFQTLVKRIASHILATKPADVEALYSSELDGETVTSIMNNAVATIGEKLNIRRFAVETKTDNDAFGQYMHMGGRIGVLTVVEGTTDETVAKDVAMHAAALNPKYVSREEVDQAELDHERDVLRLSLIHI